VHTESDNALFERRLDDAIARLQQCQQERSLQSCYDCGQCLGCEIRQRYVQAVYDSMSKGETGGFEF